MAIAGTIGTPSSEERGLDLRTVTTVTAAALAIADMIGIGVFTSLGFQVQGIPSAFAVLMLWVVGGIAALCGALSYGELAAALPRSGGEYNFLSHIYGRSIGFVAGWISATVGFAAPVALAAMAFAGYFDGIAPGIINAATVEVFSTKVSLIPIGIVWLVGLIHLSGVALGSTFHNYATGLKLALIVVLIFAGLALGTPQPISFAPSASDLHYITGAPFAVGLVFVMYAYSGWNAATYIAGEIHNPQRSLPLAILAATLIVITLYVGLNAVFLYTTPIDQMAGQVEVALIAGKHIFGDAGGRLVGALICLGLISSISAMIWIGPRVTQVMGEDIPMMRVFARTSKNGVPAIAIIFQLCVTTLLMATRSFESVLDYIQFSLTFCSFLAVLGVIVLRIREPDLKRPYRMWGYPFTPAVFLAVTTFMMYYLVIERPWQSLASIATMLAGLLIYAISLTQAPSRAKTESSIDG
jgi:APA family basic amino acid/polyamine antiporter